MTVEKYKNVNFTTDDGESMKLTFEKIVEKFSLYSSKNDFVHFKVTYKSCQSEKKYLVLRLPLYLSLVNNQNWILNFTFFHFTS